MTNLKNEFLIILKTMKFIKTAVLKVFLICLFFSSCKTNDNVESPNVIFILTDDLGFADLSSYGSNTINTPKI